MMKYKDSGVDIEAGYEAVKLMRPHIQSTFRPEVLTDIGGFGGLFQLDTSKYTQPVLVSSTDGVGTKLKIAFLLNRHDTVGIDCVAMCVNDIICCGAEPLFFLDYIAVARNRPEQVAEIVKGISAGCLAAGCSLIGGETAEMPGFYAENEYDIAGFAVGVADKDRIIDGKDIKDGDKLIGIASSGLHSNGYSLVRKLLKPNEDKMREFVQSLGCSLGDELIKPTKIYVKSIAALCSAVEVKGISHITGGGFIENIPRMLPKGLKPVIHCGSWTVHPIFGLLQDVAELEDKDAYNTFNMGIGMVVAVSPGSVPKALAALKKSGEEAFVIGEVKTGEEGLELC